MFDLTRYLCINFFLSVAQSLIFQKLSNPFPRISFGLKKSFSQAASIGMDRGVSVSSVQASETILEN